MRPDAHELIRRIVKMTTAAGLGLHDANALFNAIYRSDVMMMAAGDRAKAAEIAGVDRSYFGRQTHQLAKRNDESLSP